MPVTKNRLIRYRDDLVEYGNLPQRAVEERYPMEEEEPKKEVDEQCVVSEQTVVDQPHTEEQPSDVEVDAFVVRSGKGSALTSKGRATAIKLFETTDMNRKEIAEYLGVCPAYVSRVLRDVCKTEEHRKVEVSEEVKRTRDMESQEIQRNLDIWFSSKANIAFLRGESSYNGDRRIKCPLWMSRQGVVYPSTVLALRKSGWSIDHISSDQGIIPGLVVELVARMESVGLLSMTSFGRKYNERKKSGE